MNKVYRVIWNATLQAFQVVSELAKGRGKTKSKRASKIAFKLSFLSASVSLAALSHAAPMVGGVTAGQAEIHSQGDLTTITQSSQNAAINWQSFSVAPQETVQFKQPNSDSITLNRVTGNEASDIQGQIKANGHIFISNPNGVLIGNNAQINVGGLVATTQKISDEDFMANRFNFTGEGKGVVENRGHIQVPKGGVVALVAPIVKNSGKITALQANTLLASAEHFSITLPSNNKFSYQITKGTLQGLVDNGGAILADGGYVVLTAKGLSAVKKSVINHSGTIQANTVSNKNGKIELLGDLDNSQLNVAGKLIAEAPNGGDGGFIETSAAKVKIDDNVNVSTKSTKGSSGTWLIDPNDFVIGGKNADMTANTLSRQLDNGNVTVKSTNGKATGKGDIIINKQVDWNKNRLTLSAQNDILINKTLNGTGTASLVMEYGLATSDGGESDFYLQKYVPLAERTAAINLPEGKNLLVRKGSAGEFTTFDVIHKMPEILEDGTNAEFPSNHIALGQDIDLSYTKTLNNPKFAGWNTTNKMFFNGLGHTVFGLYIEAQKMKNVGFFRSFYGYLNNIKVQGNINALGYSSYIGGLIGSKSLGRSSLIINNSSFIGSIVSEQGSNVGGLFGFLAGPGALDPGYVGITNTYFKGKVVGGNSVGGLIGYGGGYNGMSLTKSYAEADVYAKFSNVGGIIGESSALSVSRSYFIGNVSGAKNVGGIVGIFVPYVHGYVGDSYVNGKISGNDNIGGLVGAAGSTAHIDNNYFYGNVSGGDFTGYLVGSLSRFQSDYDSRFLLRSSYAINASQKKDELYNIVGNDAQERIRNSSMKTPAEMKSKDTFIGWDFNNIWEIKDGQYPTLRNVGVVTPEAPPAVEDVDEPEVEPVKPEVPQPQPEIDHKPKALELLKSAALIRKNMENKLTILANQGVDADIVSLNNNIANAKREAQAEIEKVTNSQDKLELNLQLEAITLLDDATINAAKQTAAQKRKEAEDKRLEKETAEQVARIKQKLKDAARDAYNKAFVTQKQMQARLNNGEISFDKASEQIEREKEAARKAIEMVSDASYRSEYLAKLNSIKSFVAVKPVEQPKPVPSKPTNQPKVEDKPAVKPQPKPNEQVNKVEVKKVQSDKQQKIILNKEMNNNQNIEKSEYGSPYKIDGKVSFCHFSCVKELPKESTFILDKIEKILSEKFNVNNKLINGAKMTLDSTEIKALNELYDNISKFLLTPGITYETLGEHLSEIGVKKLEKINKLAGDYIAGNSVLINHYLKFSRNFNSKGLIALDAKLAREQLGKYSKYADKLLKAGDVIGNIAFILDAVNGAKDIIDLYEATNTNNIERTKDILVNNIDKISVLPVIAKKATGLIASSPELIVKMPMLAAKSSEIVAWASNIGGVAAGIALFQLSLKVGELASGEDLGKAFDMDIQSMLTNVNNFRMALDAISLDLVAGRISEQEAKIKFHTESKYTHDALLKILDNTMVLDGKLFSLRNIHKWTVQSIAHWTGRGEKLSEISKTMVQMLEAIDKYKFEDVVEISKIRKIANGNFN